MTRMEKPARFLALMAVCLAAVSIGVEAHADDEPARDASKPPSFRLETPENEPSGEEPKEVDGFWKIPGKNSWIKLGGFVMLDVIHDFDAIGSETDFIPSTIPVDGGTPAEGSEGRTTYSIRQTRVSLDSRTTAGKGMIRAFASIDFFGGTDDDPQLRIRQAFFRMERLVGGGDLTVGQTWSYFMDTVALPETLDYEIPAYSVFIRQGLVGWKKTFGPVDFLASVEEPSSDVEGADGLTSLPDLVAAGRWEQKWGHLKLAALVRQLRASLNDGPVATENTAGLMFSGQVLIGKKKKDNFSFQISTGDSIGRYIDDPPPDAVYNTVTGDLDPLDKISGYLSYRHWWSDVLRTNVVYSALEVDNLAIQAGDDLESAQYSALNLIWSPYEKLDLGIEVLYGTREDLNGASGSATRLQMSGKYAF
jgi:hypothetical protein